MHPNLEPIETASQGALQLDRLRQSLRYAFANVPHYQQRHAERHVGPDDLRSLSDLAKFPFTTKSDLRDTYPFGMFAVPRELSRACIHRVARRASRRSSDTPRETSKPGRALWRDLFAPPADARGRHDAGDRRRVRPAGHRRSCLLVALPPTSRAMRRMARITGRCDDMLIIRGVNVFPSQIEELILAMPSLAPHHQLEVISTCSGCS